MRQQSQLMVRKYRGLGLREERVPFRIAIGSSGVERVGSGVVGVGDDV